jgi:hypothetical protein
LTHPANWGPYKLELFAQVPVLAGLGEVNLLTEPEAAAAHYARNDRLNLGSLIAVYDLGGGTFDATVLRTTEHGFEILGRPEGVEGLGGVDFDEAVFTHVDQTLDGAVSRLDPADPRATSAVIRLRNECVNAKEALSADTETSIPVLLPDLQTEVRLTRGEFERMIRPAIGATIASLRRALQSAQVDPAQLRTVLLVGGSSRIPMVAHLVSAELGCPTSVDAHPKHAIALGAAAVGAARTGPEPVIVPPTPVEAEPDHPAAPPTETAAAGGAIAAVPLLGAAGAAAAGAAAAGAGMAPPPLKDQKDKGRFSRRGRAENNLVPEAGPDPAPEPDPEPEPEPEPFVPFDDQPRDTHSRRRTPVMVGALVLIAALAGGGTVAARALSHSTPPTNSTGVSHTSSSTPTPSSSTHTTPAKLHAQSSHPITTTPVAPTTAPVHPISEPASQPSTQTSPTHHTSPSSTWTSPTAPTSIWTSPTSPPPTSPSTSTSTGSTTGTGGSGGGTGGTSGSGTGTGGTSGSGSGTGSTGGTGGNP